MRRVLVLLSCNCGHLSSVSMFVTELMLWNLLQGYYGNLKFPRCIPMDILAWTDCVRSSAGKISYIDIFSSSNLQKY
jgi:hypothetical protein